MSIEIERILLALLCNGRGGEKLREELLSQLRGYSFQCVEHQVLFDCLQAIPLDRPELIRELLPARLVRAGFPDFDLGVFFVPSDVSDEEAQTMCRELMEARMGEQEQVPRRLRSSG